MNIHQKESGAFFTPGPIAATLVTWAAKSEGDRLLDPSCGDGAFIASHRNSVGIERDPIYAQTAKERAPWALVHEGDFFSWAAQTPERFECAAGNPPFIRYQTFAGATRAKAAELCTKLGVKFSGLASSWAPFLVATASLLRAGGRMAFVVPAEIGHAPYSAPLVEYLTANFRVVHIVAVRRKLFPSLSEDCWLLFASGYSASTEEIRFTAVESFEPSNRPPTRFQRIALGEWRDIWRKRLRPYLLSAEARMAYQLIAKHAGAKTLGSIATVGIGYVSGDNDFFHLRPSDAERLRIPGRFLHPSVRNGRLLSQQPITAGVVEKWKSDDRPILLLKLPKEGALTKTVERYLESESAFAAREAYKCRVREPWYSVPDVRVPDFFLSYMSGGKPTLVRNDAQCTCTNSVHGVHLKHPNARERITAWNTDFTMLSTELEGHPLGGGMLKLEPREASSIVLASPEARKNIAPQVLADAIETLRLWRHHGGSA